MKTHSAVVAAAVAAEDLAAVAGAEAVGPAEGMEGAEVEPVPAGGMAGAPVLAADPQGEHGQGPVHRDRRCPARGQAGEPARDRAPVEGIGQDSNPVRDPAAAPGIARGCSPVRDRASDPAEARDRAPVRGSAPAPVVGPVRGSAPELAPESVLELAPGSAPESGIVRVGDKGLAIVLARDKALATGRGLHNFRRSCRD